MFDRGWLDPIPYYPTVYLCALFLGVTLRLFKFNKGLEIQGIYNDKLYPGRQGIAFMSVTYIPINILFVFFDIYLIYIFGWSFLWICFHMLWAYVIGTILGLLPYSHYLMPILCLVLGLMMVDWFNLASIPGIHSLNEEFFRLTAGRNGD